MSLKLMTVDDVRRQVKQRLLDGWLLLFGGADVIGVVEQRCYPSGTSKNKNMELYFIPAPVPHAIVICKRTEELRDLLDNPPDWDRTVALILPDELTDVGDGIKAATVQQIFHHGDIESAIEALFADGWGDTP